MWKLVTIQNSLLIPDLLAHCGEGLISRQDTKPEGKKIRDYSWVPDCGLKLAVKTSLGVFPFWANSEVWVNLTTTPRCLLGSLPYSDSSLQRKMLEGLQNHALPSEVRLQSLSALLVLAFFSIWHPVISQALSLGPIKPSSFSCDTGLWRRSQ